MTMLSTERVGEHLAQSGVYGMATLGVLMALIAYTMAMCIMYFQTTQTQWLRLAALGGCLTSTWYLGILLVEATIQPVESLIVLVYALVTGNFWRILRDPEKAAITDRSTGRFSFFGKVTAFFLAVAAFLIPLTPIQWAG